MYKIIYKNINDINKEDLLNFYQYIYNEKKKKIDKLKKETDKLVSILGEYLLAQLLKKYYNIDYKKVKFNYNKNGKPFISNYNIFFNISHSHNFAACIISDNECGIDIELVRPVNLNIINTFTNSNEKEYILNNNADVYYRLFKIFTLKEAYLKMMGSKITNIKNIKLIINSNDIKCLDNNIIFFSKLDNNIIISISIKKS